MKFDEYIDIERGDRLQVERRSDRAADGYRSITLSAFIRLIVSMTSFMPTLREFR